MYISIRGEMMQFLYACFAGALIFLCYDIIFLSAKRQQISLLFLNLCDGMFLLLACAIMTFMIFYTGNGIVRGYEFAGVFLGAILYKSLLSSMICAVLSKVFHFFTLFFKIFFKILLTPIEFMYKMIYKCIVMFSYPIVTLTKKVMAYFRFRLKNVFKTVRKTKKKM